MRHGRTRRRPRPGPVRASVHALVCATGLVVLSQLWIPDFGVSADAYVVLGVQAPPYSAITVSGWLGWRTTVMTVGGNGVIVTRSLNIGATITTVAVSAVALLVSARGAWGILVVTMGHRADRRRARGLCGRCGYDLRAVPEQACPECGADRHHAGVS